MAVLNPGQASQQMKEAYEDLRTLSSAHQLMDGDQTITAALAIAEQKMLSAAYNYVQSHQGGQTAQPQTRPAHRSPGVGGQQAEQRPYSRTDVRPPHSGVSGHQSAVALPIPPLNTAPQPTTITRISAQGHVPTAPGLPDAVVPQNAQLHPRTVARIQAAQGLEAVAQRAIDDAGAGAVALPAPPPTQGGDRPDVPLMGPPGYPGALPTT
jgi:hypothetical protein